MLVLLLPEVTRSTGENPISVLLPSSQNKWSVSYFRTDWKKMTLSISFPWCKRQLGVFGQWCDTLAAETRVSCSPSVCNVWPMGAGQWLWHWVAGAQWKVAPCLMLALGTCCQDVSGEDVLVKGCPFVCSRTETLVLFLVARINSRL